MSTMRIPISSRLRTKGLNIWKQLVNLSKLRELAGDKSARVNDPLELKHAQDRLMSHYKRFHYKRFFVLSSPRSGTHMLRTSLDMHPNVICMTEMFNPDHTEGKFEFNADTAAEKILSDFVYSDHANQMLAVGFSLQRVGARFGNWPNLWSLLEQDLDLHVISLRRENLLRRYLSYQLRQREKKDLGRGTPAPNLEGSPPKPMKFEVDLLIRDFELQERKIAKFNERFASHPLITVSYEQLCQQYEETMSRLQMFLGVPQVRLKPETKKRAIPPLARVISNYWELKATFADTRWAGFWED